jgi:hypothetical protein
MLSVCDPLTFVYCPISVSVLTLAMSLPINPFTFIEVTFFVAVLWFNLLLLEQLPEVRV